GCEPATAPPSRSAPGIISTCIGSRGHSEAGTSHAERAGSASASNTIGLDIRRPPDARSLLPGDYRRCRHRSDGDGPTKEWSMKARAYLANGFLRVCLLLHKGWRLVVPAFDETRGREPLTECISCDEMPDE